MTDRSYVVNMKQRLHLIEDSLTAFIKKQTLVKTRVETISGMRTIAPRYSFSHDLDIQQRQQQNILLNRFQEWEEHFRLMIRVMPSQFKKEINNILHYIVSRIELKHDWLIEATIEANAKQISKNISFLYEVFLILEESKTGYLLVPDSDYLINSGSISQFGPLFGLTEYRLVLLPSVLDEIRLLARSGSLGELQVRAQKLLDEVKRLKRKGSLIKGIELSQAVTLQVPPVEADFDNTLKWLDRNLLDDRIIAALLAFEHSHPDRIVVLLSDNINLQNKAELAGIPYFEP